jgi:hypothetical protein
MLEEIEAATDRASPEDLLFLADDALRRLRRWETSSPVSIRRTRRFPKRDRAPVARRRAPEVPTCFRRR